MTLREAARLRREGAGGVEGQGVWNKRMWSVWDHHWNLIDDETRAMAAASAVGISRSPEVSLRLSKQPRRMLFSIFVSRAAMRCRGVALESFITSMSWATVCCDHDGQGEKCEGGEGGRDGVLRGARKCVGGWVREGRGGERE
jgi:hypothetical protein